MSGYFVVYLGFAIWVFFDSRKRAYPGIWWALATVFLGPLIVPVYLAKRNLKAGETREGGLAWNILRNFSLFWTITLVIAFIAGMINAAPDSNPQSDAEKVGTGIGIFIVMIVYFIIWFIPVAGAITTGLLLKKSSIIETGPTGALNTGTATSLAPVQAPSRPLPPPASPSPTNLPVEVYLLREGQQTGPYALNDMRAWLQDGTVTQGDLVWYEGIDQWVSLGTILR
jgi:hypothetical protein